MPEGRMLRKKISRDEEVAKLSDKTIVLYTWCIPHLDVKGKILADAHILKGVVVPHLKNFTLKVIDKCVNEMGDSGLVVVYGNGHKYMQFKGFNKNQKINEDREAPSEIPDPTPEQLQSNSRVTPAKDNYKLIISKVPPADPLDIYNYYVKTIKAGGKEDAVKSITKLLKTVSKEDLIGRIDAYKQSILKSKKQDPDYYIQANNFFGIKARWKDFEPVKIIKYGLPNPDCKTCKGSGKVLVQSTNEIEICKCRSIL